MTNIIYKGFSTLTITFLFAIPAAYSLPWQPAPGTSWQWQLNDPVDNDSLDVDTSFDVDMYDIDLFDTPAATITALHNAGKKVICYFSAGSYEEWRSDAESFPEQVLGNALDGWQGERWLDIRADAVKTVMTSRLALAVQKGCDGVEPDNVDGYTNNPGFPLSPQDQIDYNRWLAQAAHQKNLSIGLKNDLAQINQLVNDFDWALNEQCFEFNECDLLDSFINAGKAVFGVEYTGNPDVFCLQANAKQFSWLKKNSNLHAPVLADCLTYGTTPETSENNVIIPIILMLLDDNAENGAYISPYTLNKFRDVIRESRLQIRTEPFEDQDIDLSKESSFSSQHFHLVDNQYMTFTMNGTGDDKRSELRQIEQWSTADSVGNKIIGKVRLIKPQSVGLDQYTWMQVHNKKRTENEINSPLLRLVWVRTKQDNGVTKTDHLWAALKTDATGNNTEWFDLGKRPTGFFAAEIKIRSGLLKVKIKGEIAFPERNISYWNQFTNYFKAGVYLQQNGNATVQFETLKYFEFY